MLYLIEILHQTTTISRPTSTTWLLYLIEILHQTTTYGRQRVPQKCCILSKFYIKPQHSVLPTRRGIVVSYRNSTSNHNRKRRDNTDRSVVSYRNSTSNHNRTRIDEKRPRVVSYRNSTSNHNVMSAQAFMMKLYLIEILHQTTTRRRTKR